MTNQARLEQLLSLRARLDAEIERERRYLSRVKRLRKDLATVVGNQHGWSSRRVWSERIIAATAEHYEITAPDVISRRQCREYVAARHVAAWLLRESGRSLSEIGKLLGGRDHTTVLAGCRRVDAEPALMAVAVALRTELLGGVAA